MFTLVGEAAYRQGYINIGSQLLPIGRGIDEVGGVALTIICGVGFSQDWPVGTSSGILVAGICSLAIGIVGDVVYTMRVRRMTSEWEQGTTPDWVSGRTDDLKTQN